MVGVDPSSSPSMPSIMLAMAFDPTYAIYTQSERAAIAKYANESLFLTNYYNSGSIEERLPSNTLTSIPGLKIFGGSKDKYRYSMLVEFQNRRGRSVETRPIYITSPTPLTSSELIQEQHYATLNMLAKDSPKGSAVELIEGTLVNYRLLSILRAN